MCIAFDKKKMLFSCQYTPEKIGCNLTAKTSGVPTPSRHALANAPRTKATIWDPFRHTSSHVLGLRVGEKLRFAKNQERPIRTNMKPYTNHTRNESATGFW